MNVRLRPEAEADLEDAARWYEDRRRGLGSEFLDEVLSTLRAIAERPDRYARVEGAIRRAVTARFPFGIFYVVEEPGTVVVAILHSSRDPSRWKGRT